MNFDIQNATQSAENSGKIAPEIAKQFTKFSNPTLYF